MPARLPLPVLALLAGGFLMLAGCTSTPGPPRPTPPAAATAAVATSTPARTGEAPPAAATAAAPPPPQPAPGEAVEAAVGLLSAVADWALPITLPPDRSPATTPGPPPSARRYEAARDAENELVIRDLVAGTERRIPLPPAARVGGDALAYGRDISIVWSPSGRFFRFARFLAPDSKRSVFVVDAATGALSEFPDACRWGYIFVPEWAPDGDRLVIPTCTERRMGVLDAPSRAVLPLPDGVRYQLLPGRMVLIQLDRGGIALVDGEGQTVREWLDGRVEHGSWTGIPPGAQSVVTPVGPLLAVPAYGDSKTPFSASCEGTVFYLATDAPDRPRCLAPREPGAHGVAVALSPGGTRLAVLEERLDESPTAKRAQPGGIRSRVVRVIDLRTMQEVAVQRMQERGGDADQRFLLGWSEDGSALSAPSYVTAA